MPTEMTAEINAIHPTPHTLRPDNPTRPYGKNRPGDTVGTKADGTMRSMADCANHQNVEPIIPPSHEP